MLPRTCTEVDAGGYTLEAEAGFEPANLWVMSPARYRTAPLRAVCVFKVYVNRIGLSSHLTRGSPTGAVPLPFARLRIVLTRLSPRSMRPPP